MGPVLTFGGLTFAVAHHALARDGVPVMVGGRGLDLLARLLEQPGEVVPIDALIRAGWGSRAVQANNLSVQMSSLRKALGTTGSGGPFIRTVVGRGYQLCTDVVRTEEPPQAGRQWPKAATTGFIGRTPELAALAGALAASRLLTVIGAGGVGKTRLVQHLLGSASRSWVGVDLAPASTVAQMMQALAAALGDVEPALDALAARLKAAPLLLVLDNAEHVAAELGAALGRLLPQCPELTVLVTSRQVLGAAGEAVFRLGPMALPPAAATPAEAGSYDCIALFAARAAAAQPGFVLTADNCQAVATICRRLDGIALAIEMVAPRLRVMSPAEIADGLEERFGLLAPAGPEVLPRQRTLATMLDWSWNLLDAAERAMLIRLAVFRAPATLRAVAGVAPDRDGWNRSGLEAMAGLADKSLAVAERSGGDTRYRLLETTRDYVLARTPGRERRGLRDRHAAYMAGLLETGRDEWPGAPTTQWIDRYAGSADDVRAALAWTTGDAGQLDDQPGDPPGDAPGDQAVAVRLVTASLPLWLELPGSPLGEMHGWFDRVAPCIGRDTPALALAWFRIGQSWRAAQFGDVEHRAIAGQAVAAARRAGDETALGVALMREGHTLMRRDTMAAAAALFQEAESHLRAAAPGKWLCLTLTRRADAMARLGQLQPSMTMYEEAIDLAHALEFRLGRVVSIGNLTEVLFTLGEREEAVHRLRSLVARIPPGPRSPAMATLAAHLALDGQDGAAFAAVADVADWALVTGMEGPLAWAAETVALLLARAGRFTTAATLSGYAARVLPAVDIRFGSRLAVHRDLDRILTRALPAQERSSLARAGGAWNVRQAAAAVSVACRSSVGQSSVGQLPVGQSPVGSPAGPAERVVSFP